jgi:hypothetical protein
MRRIWRAFVWLWQGGPHLDEWIFVIFLFVILPPKMQREMWDAARRQVEADDAEKAAIQQHRRVKRA